MLVLKTVEFKAGRGIGGLIRQHHIFREGKIVAVVYGDVALAELIVRLVNESQPQERTDD